MKILEICTSEALGGLELYFLSCCQKLQSPETEIYAYVTDKSPIDEKVSKLGIGVDTVNSKIGFLRKIRNLMRTVRTFRPDIVHVHVKTDLLAIGICKMLIKKRFKYVYTRHMNLPGNKKDVFHRFVYNKIDLLITITERLKEQVLKNTSLPAERVRVLYHGVPESTEGNIDLIPGLKHDQRFKIGLIARIDEHKNQHIVIEAMKLLRNRQKHVSAYLIGKNTDEDYQKRIEGLIKEYNLEGEVKLTGFVSDPIDLMGFFDVILLTSPDETFGLVLAEAMRAGVAVIGADGGGVPEIIDHEETGMLFKPDDPTSLALAIEKLINYPKLLDRLAIKGKEKADQIFNEKTHFTELKKIFRDLLHIS